MNRPFVSVVIPVHNRPAAVARAIESVLTQTFQDFEVIVVDDASTDATPTVVAAIADPRVRLIRHGRKQGGGAARNTGIRAGSAPFVAFLDSDDEWLPHKIARQLEVFERGGAAVGLVYTGAALIQPDGRAEIRLARCDGDVGRALLTRNIVGETSVGMVRREALERVGAFDESLPCSQDKDLWLRISERFLIDCVPEPLARIGKARGGRISTDVAATLVGRELYFRKHHDKLVTHGVLHLFLRDTGWVHLREARDGRLARRYFLRSIAANPFALPGYACLTIACLPMSWLDRMATWNHRLIDALKRSSGRSGGHRTVSSRA